MRNLCVAVLVVCSGSIGCAPTKLLERPADWPVEWRERTLYHVSAALIYASSTAAAGEAERLLTAIADQFGSDTGQPVGKGLVLVTDSQDPLIVTDPDVLFEMARRGDLVHRDLPKSDDHEPGASAKADTKRAELGELGVPIEVILRVTPVGVTQDDVATHLALPVQHDDSIHWIVALPTRSACKSATRELVHAALKKEEISFAERLLIAPLMPFMESFATDKLAEEREVVLYAAMAGGVREWTPQQRREAIGRFRSKKDDDFSRRFETEKQSLQGLSEIDASSQPATQPDVSPDAD